MVGERVNGSSHTVAHVACGTPKHEIDSLTHRFAVPPLPSGEGSEADGSPAVSLGQGGHRRGAESAELSALSRGERVADEGGRVRGQSESSEQTLCLPVSVLVSGRPGASPIGPRSGRIAPAI